MIRRLARFTLLLLLTLSSGCGGNGEEEDRADSTNPYMRRARERAADKDTAGAIQFYKKALADNPELSRAHLELGILFDENKDFIGAIYHYGAYLDLKPTLDTTQRKWVEDSIRHAKYSLVTEMPLNDVTRKTMEDLSVKVEQLKVQNTKLIEIIRQMQKQAAAGNRITMPDLTPYDARTSRPPAPSAPSAPAEPGPTPAAARAPVVPATPARVIPSEYKVVPGDTLSVISKKVYGDASQWKRIRDANTGQAVERLKPGTTLKIPQ